MREPGIYTGMPVAEYFSDPAPEPSLTQSIAKVLLEKSPLHAWYAHPRLNPDFEESDETKFDVGVCAHALLIGRGREVVAAPEEFADWRTKAVKDLREKYRVEGKTLILGTQYQRADRMARAAREQLELRDKGYLFSEVEGGETVLIWREVIDGQPIYCRQMLDYLHNSTYADYKTTDQNVAPWALGRKMVGDGWDIQAAFAERGLNALGYTPHIRDFLFVVQESTVPYALNVVELSESNLTLGRKQVAVALRLWARSMKTNRWPGYPLKNVVLDYPAWAEAAWLDREENEFAADLLAAG